FGRGAFTLELDSPAGNAGAIRAITGVNTWGGDITMPSNAYVGADINSSLTLSGILSDSQTGSSLTKVGPGLVVINNTNSYSGPTAGRAQGGLGELVVTSTETYGGDTTIVAGDVNIQNVFALGNGNGTATVSDGASLFLQFPVDGNTYTVKGESLVLQGSGLNG